MKQYAVEFTGTFFLTLVVALTGNPLAIGAVLVAMVYMGGAVSGAHYNPAVTLALYLRGAVKYKQAVRYMGVQLAASFVAAAVYYLLKGVTFSISPAEGVSFSQALLVELLFTFALASTVLYTAASKATKGNQFYGLAIGLVVAAGAFAAGPISGGALNPAVGVGPLLFDMATLQSHGSWVLLYLIGPISGGALAAMLYREVVLEG